MLDDNSPTKPVISPPSVYIKGIMNSKLLIVLMASAHHWSPTASPGHWNHGHQFISLSIQ